MLPTNRSSPFTINLPSLATVAGDNTLLAGSGNMGGIVTILIRVLLCCAFLGFAAWTLRGDTLDDDEAAKAHRSTRSAVMAASVAFRPPSGRDRLSVLLG